MDKVFPTGEGVISFWTHPRKFIFLLFFLFSREFFFEDVFPKYFMEGSYKRGRSRSRAADRPRAMSVSRSRSRGAQAVRVLYMPTAEETKYFDTSFSQSIASAADWTGTEVPCTNYVQTDGVTVGAYTDSALIPSAIGAGFGNVVGSKYKIKKIRCRGQVYSNALSDQADVKRAAVVRLLLVQDQRPNGAQAQGEEVFLDMGTAAQGNHAFLSMGAGQAGRFRVLKDFFVVLQPANASTDGTNTASIVGQATTFAFTWKPKTPLEVLLKANSATPAIASLSSQNIFLLAHTDQTNHVVEGCARCYYMG